LVVCFACFSSTPFHRAGVCVCVGASLDAQGSILALTQQEQRERDGEMKLYFKTSLAEVLPAGEAYRLNVRSQLVQTVQFLVSKGGVTLFLFIIEGMFVRLYQVSCFDVSVVLSNNIVSDAFTKARRRWGQNHSTAIVVEVKWELRVDSCCVADDFVVFSEIIKKFVWYQWDANEERL
jgi:hypothetical protein